MCDSNGWPSSHSQYMCFFAIYLTLLATCRMTFADEFRRAFVAFLPWPVAMVVMYSRVYLGYHTTAQVLAGGTLGLMLGTGWFLLMNYVVSPWFPILEDSSLCQYLRIKDSSHIPDIIGFEYTNSREARNNSSKSGNEKISKDWRQVDGYSSVSHWDDINDEMASGTFLGSERRQRTVCALWSSMPEWRLLQNF